MYVYRNNEVRSRDHIFRGKAASITNVFWKLQYSMLTDAQRNMTELIAAFWNFANLSKKWPDEKWQKRERPEIKNIEWLYFRKGDWKIFTYFYLVI
jgi:hypothetical protein